MKHEIEFHELLELLKSPEGNDAEFPFKIRFFETTDTSAQTLSQTSSALTDLTFFVSHSSTSSRSLLPQVDLSITFNQVLYARRRMEIVLHHIECILKSSNTTASLSAIPLSLPSSFSASAAYIPDPSSNLNWSSWPGPITRIFEQNALLHPSKRCLIEQAGEYSYDVVYKACVKLACHLLQKGIEREDVVAIFAHRSASLVVAIMGVLMTGATFCVIGILPYQLLLLLMND